MNTTENTQEIFKTNMKTIIEANLTHFNTGKHKNLLSVKHYVDNGDQYKILKGDKIIADFMTLDQCYYALLAIINYTAK